MKQNIKKMGVAQRSWHRLMCISMAAVMAVGFIACDKDKDKEPETSTSTFTSLQVSVTNGGTNDNISKVIAGIMEIPYSEVANYNGGNFTLQMKTPTNLFPLSTEMPASITISDVNTQETSWNIIGCYDANNNLVSHIALESATGDVIFSYVDRDCSLTGQVSESYDGVNYVNKYNAQLKKGWNKVYRVVISETEYLFTTTAQPNMKWTLHNWGTEKSAVRKMKGVSLFK